jgi:hypothetical protein
MKNQRVPTWRLAGFLSDIREVLDFRIDVLVFLDTYKSRITVNSAFLSKRFEWAL